MGEDPAAIREQIERTRERMGETVDAIGYKADVPARTRASISGGIRGVKQRIAGAGARLGDVAPDADDLKRARRQGVGVAQENPLGLALGAAAVGFLAGMLIPSTHVEDEQLGPVADEVKRQAEETGREALERGRQVAQDTVQTAVHSAQDAAARVRDRVEQSVQRQADSLGASVEDRLEEVRRPATSQ